MEILVNGRAGLASTDDDVSLGELFDYLRGQFAQQRLVVRSWTIDGDEIEDADSEAVRNATPAGYGKLEIEVAPIIVVAQDVLEELESSVPELAGQAVQVTELLQRSEFAKGQQELSRFIGTVSYVSDALNTIVALTGIDLPALADEADVSAGLKRLGEHLKGVQDAIKDNDFTTIGDVMEFDVSPEVKSLVALVSVLRKAVDARVAEMDAGGGE